MFCGKLVRCVTKEKHLGHEFNSNFCHTSNLVSIDNVIRDMKLRTNAIITQFKPVSWSQNLLYYPLLHFTFSHMGKQLIF